MKFLKHFEQIDQLRILRKKELEKGSIPDRDLTLEIPAQDWPYLCQSNHRLYKTERERAE